MTGRLIEEHFPQKEVSILSAREKSIRQGHISTLHIWWARRPLAASRATAYAALLPTPETQDELQEKHKFIIDFAKWENSVSQGLIEKARNDILAAFHGNPPRVLDPFAGGGSIPLEALTLGCETYASDLNPVAVLIQKAILEYPQKYGLNEDAFLQNSKTNSLLNDIKKWANWVQEEAKKELGDYFPQYQDNATPVGYIWAHTIPCQNPSCQQEIPLMRHFWLVKRGKTKIALFPDIDTENERIEFKIVGTGYLSFPAGFVPERGTVSRAIVTCPLCGSTIEASVTRNLFIEKKSRQRMIAVVTHKAGHSGKQYRTATQEDTNIFSGLENALHRKRQELLARFDMDFIPDEPTPEGGGQGAERAFSVRNYGLETWGDLFNSRQKLTLITFADKIRQAHTSMLASGYRESYATAISTYLALGLDRLADYNSMLCVWHNGREGVAHTFGRPTLSMIWDYIEVNPFSESTGNWNDSILYLCRAVEHIIQLRASPANVAQSSAMALLYPDNFFDAVFTDPPYYDNVPYSYLSDFFYVWLKRTIGDFYPELFSTPLSPKKNEIVAYSNGPGGFEEGTALFETMLNRSFQEIYRVLKPDGIAIIVYAHKSTKGWESLINSLLDSKLVVTASWSLNTEMRSRLRSHESAALASSTYLVARKLTRFQTAFYNDVKSELQAHLKTKLQNLWDEQKEPLDPSVKRIIGRDMSEKDLFSGADFFISAIGSAIEIFGKYEKIIDYEGEVIRADRLLDDVRNIVTDFAVTQILHNGFGGKISNLTRFYVLWRWNYGETRVQFDDARKLAQSCAIDLAQEWDKRGFIQKEGEFIRVLGPQMRPVESLEGSRELIDVLHYSCLLWGSSGKRNEMLTILNESDFGKDESFYRVAQAISETLVNDSKEKQLLDGFLAGKERIKHDIKNGVGPTTLSDWQ